MVLKYHREALDGCGTAAKNASGAYAEVAASVSGAAIDSAVRAFRDSTGRDTAAVADSIARVVPGAPVIPRAAPLTPRPDTTVRPRRDTSAGVRP